MGFERVTVANLEVVKVDAERNLILIKGALPGSKGTLLTIKETVKNKS
jgi:large subunit ribosomal protein L3